MLFTDWLTLYDNTKSKFDWFIKQYFPELPEKLKSYRLANRTTEIYSTLTQIWYELPDSKFNIIENPVGWDEFLALLEEYPEYPKQEEPTELNPESKPILKNSKN